MLQSQRMMQQSQPTQEQLLEVCTSGHCLSAQGVSLGLPRQACAALHCCDGPLLAVLRGRICSAYHSLYSMGRSGNVLAAGCAGGSSVQRPGDAHVQRQRV